MDPDFSKSQKIDLLISGGYVLTVDQHNNTYSPGSVAILDGIIVDVGDKASLESKYNPQERINASGYVVMPGLINLHCHASNSLIRGLGRDLPLHDWLERVCWPCMDHASDEDLFNGVLLSCLEMLQNGITTFCDMWKNIGLTVDAVTRSRQRALIFHNIKDFGDVSRGEKELQIALDGFHRWDQAADGKISIGLGPHSVYTCLPETLRQCAEEASNTNIMIQTHASETQHEVKTCRKQHDCSPVALMGQVGLLGPGTIIAHGVHVSANDIELFKTSMTSLAHNISSNLILGSGIAPVARYLDEGITVGLGTDGAGSNDSLDLFRDLKMAVLVQKGSSFDPTSITALDGLKMVTRRAALAVGQGKQIGSLEKGKQADIILVEFTQPHLTPIHFDLKDHVVSHLVYSASGSDVDTVIVAGEVLMHKKNPLHLDVEQIQRNAQQSSERILKYMLGFKYQLQQCLI